MEFDTAIQIALAGIGIRPTGTTGAYLKTNIPLTYLSHSEFECEYITMYLANGTMYKDKEEALRASPIAFEMLLTATSIVPVSHERPIPPEYDEEGMDDDTDDDDNTDEDDEDWGS